MDINSLKLFVRVSQSGSFAAASRALNIDPSSVSRTIALLEEDIGLRLFQRTTRKLVLTEAGEVYLQRIAPLLNEFDYAIDEAHKVSNGPSGHLRMTASVAFGQACLVPHIAQFRTLYPNIKLELQLTDAVVDIVADGIDLSCRLTKNSNAQLICTRLFDTRYYVCVSPSYYKNNPKVLQPTDLEQHNCVVFTLPEYRSKWTFKDKSGNLTPIEIKSDLSISNALVLRNCAFEGLGPVLLPHWLVEKDIQQGTLIPLLDQYQVSAKDFDTAVWLLYPSRHFLPVKTRVMIDFLKAIYRENN